MSWTVQKSNGTSLTEYLESRAEMTIDYKHVAVEIGQLYEKPFGGKTRGRFRISMRNMRQLTGVKRLYEADVTALTRALYENGFSLIDMETFFVVLSHRTFTSYRRLNEEAIGTDD